MLVRKKSNALTEDSHCKFLLSDYNTWALFDVHVWISKQHHREILRLSFFLLCLLSLMDIQLFKTVLLSKSSMAIPPKP